MSPNPGPTFEIELAAPEIEDMVVWLIYIPEKYTQTKHTKLNKNTQTKIKTQAKNKQESKK